MEGDKTFEDDGAAEEFAGWDQHFTAAEMAAVDGLLNKIGVIRDAIPFGAKAGDIPNLGL